MRKLLVYSEFWKMHTTRKQHLILKIYHPRKLLCAPLYLTACPSPSKHWSDVYGYRLFVLVLQRHMNKTKKMVPFVSDVLCSSYFCLNPSMSLCISNSFYTLLNSIILYEYITIGLYTPLLIDIWEISRLKVLWIKLLWALLYKSLCKHMAYRSKYLGNELAGI